ncbi:hypothetical protein [Pseudarthrobacter sp. N5]|uniref:hypothetical protein n=1 Tax=Pseudarthrobacter sp. N5 TaxID=3418416 RepID=UPI003CFB4951
MAGPETNPRGQQAAGIFLLRVKPDCTVGKTTGWFGYQSSTAKYSIDTAGGQSGAPVYDGSRNIRAIHTNGASINAGTKFTPTGLTSSPA